MMAFSAMSASESFSTRFPLKLWRLLNRCTSGAISWSEHGRSIKIDRRRFEREYLMPIDSAFKTSNFSSFIRQLNLYGFRKVINTFRFNQPTDAVGEVDIHEYHHPFFRRGNPELLNRVQRRMKGRKECSTREECERENSPLVASILKPLDQSTPKFEQIRFDRPPLQFMDVNGQFLRQASFPQATFTAPWSACQAVSKPTPHNFLQTFTIPSALRTNPITGQNQTLTVGLPSYSSQPMVKPFPSVEPPKLPTRNIHSHVSTPQVVHPGFPMVEAIHQVLGEKALSEMVLSPAVTALSQSSAITPLMPVLNALCSPATTTTTTNISTNFLSNVNSDAFVTQAAYNLKYAGPPQIPHIFASPHPSSSNAALSTICHSLPSACASTTDQLFTVSEMPSLSHLSNMQESVFQPVANLCPPSKPNHEYIASTLNHNHLVTYSGPLTVDTLSTANNTADLIDPIYVRSDLENKEPSLQISSVQSKYCPDESVQMSLSQQTSRNSTNTVSFTLDSSPIIMSDTSSPLNNSQSVSSENFPSDDVTVSPQHNAATFLQQLSNGGFQKEPEEDSDKSCYTPISHQTENGSPNYVLPRIKLELH